MVQGSSGSGQGGIFREGAKSPVCSNITKIGGERCQESLRARVLCTWGDGKQDQGTAVTFVCRPDKYRDDACQSTEAVVLVSGLCVTQRIKTDRALFNRILTSTVQHDPNKTAQDWRTGKGECKENRSLPVQCLSL